ncbi:MAG TPA: segregation/condensation protein A, partial [Gammaproteobacteria bacterium]|nr:segregation/condensation protein A [Gammaproteobacteria bacterium]
LEVLKRSEILATHKIQKELLSVREKMGIILDTLRNKGIITFCAIFSPDEGKMGVIVTFLAMLELVKESLIDIVQAEPFGVIHLKALDYEPTKE